MDIRKKAIAAAVLLACMTSLSVSMDFLFAPATDLRDAGDGNAGK